MPVPLRRACDRRRVGAVVGTIFGGDFASQLSMGLRIPEFRATLAWALVKHGVAASQVAEIVDAYVDVLLQHMPALLDETGSFTASGLASRITKAFDLMGGAVAVDAGTASSTAALECCMDVLLSGTCDMMICVGAQQDMAPGAFVDRAMCGLLASGHPRGSLRCRRQWDCARRRLRCVAPEASLGCPT